MAHNWLPPSRTLNDPYYPYMKSLLEAYNVTGDSNFYNTLDDIYRWLHGTFANCGGPPPELPSATAYLHRLKSYILYALQTPETQFCVPPDELAIAVYLPPLRNMRATIIASFMLAAERCAVAGNPYDAGEAMSAALRATSTPVDVNSVADAKYIIGVQNPLYS